MSHPSPARSLPAAVLVALGVLTAAAPPAHAAPAPAKRATLIAAGAARIALLPPKVTNLNAMLGDTTGAPIAGALIRFAGSDGVVLCKARTKADGRATCDSSNAVSSLSGLQSGYIASFAGNARYLASTGYGTVQPV